MHTELLTPHLPGSLVGPEKDWKLRTPQPRNAMLSSFGTGMVRKAEENSDAPPLSYVNIVGSPIVRRGISWGVTRKLGQLRLKFHVIALILPSFFIQCLSRRMFHDGI
jgi:hypothetical protein